MVLLSAVPALAQPLHASNMIGATPLAIALGAGAFGLLTLFVMRTLSREAKAHKRQSSAQIATLRAALDQYEALLAGSGAVTVLWGDTGSAPRVLGPASLLLPPGTPPESVLDFAGWLPATQADGLAQALEGLRVDGRGFDLAVKTREGRLIKAVGRVLGSGVALGLEPQVGAAEPVSELAEGATRTVDGDCRLLIESLDKPAFLRDRDGALIFANQPYLDLLARFGHHPDADATPPDLFDAETGRQIAHAMSDGAGPRQTMVDLGDRSSMALTEVPLAAGSAGILRPIQKKEADPGFAHLSGIIDALATPIAIYNARRELVQFSSAFVELWGLERSWLETGPGERDVLDRLRTEGKLPLEPDYHAWRNKHLASYSLTAPRQSEPWHLPDGRTVQVIAAPAGPRGGVIYVFEDITLQLTLRSANRALLDVQRSTINALTEAVAVFGTNGRLTLSNPRLLGLWHLSMNELGQNPHIDRIAEASARAMPEDGAAIWRDLKSAIINLNPNRTDLSGRITRADGRLLDYKVIRLPDGQSMITFIDVTDSANYSRVLKERNDALVTADRLKDAFVQNVSYELRSPLTDIIGFAHLLSSDQVGSLNERQRAYTDYIRASSVSLGVLIDNILDLATVDAGIAELNPEPQDIAALIDKARAGLAASFPDIDGEKAIDLVVDLPEHMPSLVADGTRLVQVLYNLLSSAARYSDRGGIVRLKVEARAHRVLFVVEDDGLGPREDLRAALLERDNELPVRERGAGLGLAIVTSFVHLHGGTIAVERREPRGTRVIVNLPQTAVMAGIAE